MLFRYFLPVEGKKMLYVILNRAKKNESLFNLHYELSELTVRRTFQPLAEIWERILLQSVEFHKHEILPGMCFIQNTLYNLCKSLRF